MNFIFIYGPPAAGKMTVGQELAKLTGYKLFHNHVAIEPVLPYFQFGTEPFYRIVEAFRKAFFLEAARGGFEGLIFTYVWATNDETDNKYVKELRELLLAEGVKFFFVELDCDTATRLQRNGTENRLLHKPSKRDRAFSDDNIRFMDEKYEMVMKREFPYPDPFLRIGNSHLPAAEAAEKIRAAFGL